MNIDLNPETPTQAVVKAANASVIVVDSRGREIKLSRLKALDRLRLCEVVGPVNVGNQAYLGYASLAYHVSAIDGVDIAKPSNKRELEALIQNLDDDGLDAVAKGVAENFVPQEEDGEALKNG